MEKVYKYNVVLDMLRNIVIFIIGGILYYILELLYRGHSHFTMIILGGMCFLIIGLLNENIFTWEMSIAGQMLFSAVIITLLELLFGLILNMCFKLDIWNYSEEPYNFLGQICLLYTIFWYLLSLPAILIDDWLRHKLFNEEYKEYKIL